MNTDCNPNRLRKYHDKLETHRTSKSRVATPDCSIDLKRIVKGKGSFTTYFNAQLAQPPEIRNQLSAGFYKQRSERKTD